NGSVDIEIESVDGVLTVPVESVLDEGGKSYVFIAENGRAKKVEITTGRLTDTRAEVMSGISEGADIIVSGIGDLQDGANIRVK
ncbi:MAG: efflux transporter periplasmic adaptor subunit, partial [Candidatus Melainabacteria bacterium HGW-Melainabacteria-1]